ncbi:PREDICTED: putative uncharacterized protein C3orf49 [Myotis brandtii]|uniref:putative uncharacterized protein C3orf49 n=1 Tax=Myotis brandtii TaxID=109478 RepID=UPI0007046BB7|nr:PREDICTED: putative uncharacterized protein C3orf49 [Myotis brandtii]
MEFHESQQSQKKSVMKKVKTFVGRILSARHRHKPAGSGATSPQEALLPHPQSLLPGGAQELPPPRLRSTPRTRKLPQNALQLDVVEAETEEITRGSTLLRARTTRRLSVTSLPATSLPAGLHKCAGIWRVVHAAWGAIPETGSALQTFFEDVDDLIETVTDKSMKLLAQRHAELQQCEFLGDEILQSSKQFQRISKRTMRKYKLKNVCFPCTCCCF